MKIGDLVRVGAKKHPALVIRVAHKGREGRVRFLKMNKCRWVITDNVEVISESR